MLGRFFNVKHPIGENEPSCKEDSNVLKLLLDKENARWAENGILCGPPSSGKTSLLFELALSFADENKNVLFICPRKFVKLPQLLEGRNQPSNVNLRHVQIVYLETREAFLNYMASVHCCASKYFNSIIVDDIDLYFSGLTRNEDLSIIARMFAYTVDAFNFQLQKLEGTNGGVLAVSMTLPTNSEVLPHQALYERWMQYILYIKESDTNARQFQLSVFPAHCHERPSVVDVSYNLNEKNFALQEISYTSHTASQDSPSPSDCIA